MTQTFTPGPWTKLQSIETLPRTIKKQCDEFYIFGGKDGRFPVGYVYDEANAHLITTAPELLKAAKAMVSADRVGTIGDAAHAIGLLQAAISKATGVQ